MKVNMKSQKGFSLVELMVVVAIIGILAAIAIPNFQRFTAKAKQSEAKSALSAIYASERALHSEWQTYSNSFDVIGYRPTGMIRYNHGFQGATFPANMAAMPGGYAGPAPTANIATSVWCGVNVINANGCGVINTPTPPGVIAAAAVSAIAFTSEARAHIGHAAAANIDRWTINENKVVSNIFDGLP